jgi:hypothetical protein
MNKESEMKEQSVSEAPRVLMLGYNGANNTGAEALLQADIEDVRAVLGPAAHITVPALNVACLRRYLRESPTLRISQLPTLYFGAIRRMVKESDVVMLVEGQPDAVGLPVGNGMCGQNGQAVPCLCRGFGFPVPRQQAQGQENRQQDRPHYIAQPGRRGSTARAGRDSAVRVNGG